MGPYVGPFFQPANGAGSIFYVHTWKYVMFIFRSFVLESMHNIELRVVARSQVSAVSRSIPHAGFFAKLTIVVLRPNSVSGS